MRLVSFREQQAIWRASRIGALVGDEVIDLNRAAQYVTQRKYGGERWEAIASAFVPHGMVDFIAAGSAGMELAQEALDAVAHGLIGVDPHDQGVTFKFSDVVLDPPLRPPSMRLFTVFPAHLAGMSGGARKPADLWFNIPFYWKGNPHAIIGPETVIPWPGYTRLVDFELEIAAVIGTACANVSVEKAMDAVFGYTILNDVSARDIQQSAESQFTLGPSKSKDFCTTLGPVLVTKDELTNPYALSVTARVNGQTWGESDTSGMQHRWPDLVSYVAQDEWLRPGDLLSSGTVGGCSGTEYLKRIDSDVTQQILSPGDVIELEVEGIGVLRNVVGEPPAQIPSDRYPGAVVRQQLDATQAP